jgi:hypothetical protein
MFEALTSKRPYSCLSSSVCEYAIVPHTRPSLHLDTNVGYTTINRNGRIARLSPLKTGSRSSRATWSSTDSPERTNLKLNGCLSIASTFVRYERKPSSGSLPHSDKRLKNTIGSHGPKILGLDTRASALSLTRLAGPTSKMECSCTTYLVGPCPRNFHASFMASL